MAAHRSIQRKESCFGNEARLDYLGQIGTPPAGIIGAYGDILASDYLTNTADRAVGFGSVISLTGGQVAYLTETYFSSPDFAWGNYMSGAGVYERKIF